jgi:hypothetical protein
MTTSVNESTLSRANESRDYRIFEGLGQALIKQNLTVKHLLGCSENAVKIHLWTAIITYLLLARVKALYKSPYSITEIGTLVRVYGLVRMDLGQLVTTPQQLIPNQDVNELTLF